MPEPLIILQQACPTETTRFIITGCSLRMLPVFDLRRCNTHSMWRCGLNDVLKLKSSRPIIPPVWWVLGLCLCLMGLCLWFYTDMLPKLNNGSRWHSIPTALKLSQHCQHFHLKCRVLNCILGNSLANYGAVLVSLDCSGLLPKMFVLAVSA